MAETTHLNPDTPMPTGASFRLQMEGMATAGVYVGSFGWFHLASGMQLVTANVLTVFLIGLISLPLLAAMPIVLLRHLVIDNLQEKQPKVAAFLPFARFALYALQGVFVWVATREAHAWVVREGFLG
jgi:hypothetical protein